MVKYLDSIVLVLKGAWIGGTMTVPGVSGGSMAMIVGIYDRLIAAVSHIFSKPKQSMVYLLKVCIGGLIGVFLFSGLMEMLLLRFPFQTRFFFLGAVLGGAPMIFKQANVRKFSIDILLYIGIGALAVYGISCLPTGFFKFQNEFSVTYIFVQLLGGLIIALALVLPGISTSHMLLMLGLYEPVISAIRGFDVLSLLPLAVGVLIGTYLSSKVLENLFEHHKRAAYLTVFGFLIGSLVELYPGMANSAMVVPGIVCFILGAVAIYLMSRLEKS